MILYTHTTASQEQRMHIAMQCVTLPRRVGRARTLAPNFRRHSSVSPVAIARCSVAFWIFVRGSSRNTGNNAGDKAGHYSSCDTRAFLVDRGRFALLEDTVRCCFAASFEFYVTSLTVTSCNLNVDSLHSRVRTFQKE